MSGDTQFVFPPYTLDVGNQSLLRAGEKISLRSKSFAVLSYLVEHPQQLVSKEELIQTAWAGAKVVDTALRVSIQDIRKALGDDSTNPKYIETAGKNGYRFIAPISLKLPLKTDRQAFTAFVGRDAELEKLRSHLKLANNGKRQIVFVTGEPGIGKSALVDAFIAGLPTNELIITRGQCIEQYGSGEAYMPILDTLEHLCSGPFRNDSIEALRRYAPAWLINLPAVEVTPEERAFLTRQTAGATAERRLREITAFLENLAQSQTVVLVLEDLHWLDPSSLALISFLGRRKESSRLMLIGTYREGEIERFNLPLKNIEAELQLHHHCSRLSLKLLSQDAVGEYLAARFEIETVPQSVLSTIYCRSEGNPLFMVNMTDYLIDRQAIVREKDSIKLVGISDQEPVPETIRDLITRQFEALPHEDQELLETASVAGMTYSVALIALVMGKDREDIEKRCRQLSEREQFLSYVGTRTRPGGTTSSRYSFLHALCQNVIYERVGETKRRRLHQNIANVLEQAFQKEPDQVAAELALHFERAGDYKRAVHYLVQVAQKATRQSAYQEAISSATTGLTLLRSVRQAPNARELELKLQIVLGVASASTYGYSTDEARTAFARARALLENVDEKPLLLQALAGLWSFYLTRGELPFCLEIAQQMLGVASRAENELFSLIGQMAVGIVNFYLGNFSTALEHLNQSSAYDPQKYRTQAAAFGWDPAILVPSYKAYTLQLLGYSDRARKESDTALRLAQEVGSPIHTAFASGMAGALLMYRNDLQRTLESAETTIKASLEDGFSHWLAVGTILKGWALARQGRMKEGEIYLDDGLQKWRLMGTAMSLPTYLALRADFFLCANRRDQALRCVEEGLVISKQTHDSVDVAELYRLKGEAHLRKAKSKVRNANISQAEACFRQAIKTACGQQAKSFELRATMSLCRLWQRMGKTKLAKSKLAKIYGWFTEGFDTPDLKAAKDLLDQLHNRVHDKCR